MEATETLITKLIKYHRGSTLTNLKKNTENNYMLLTPAYKKLPSLKLVTISDFY